MSGRPSDLELGFGLPFGLGNAMSAAYSPGTTHVLVGASGVEDHDIESVVSTPKEVSSHAFRLEERSEECP